ncbi:MAG TPA: lamin tail domain-containing protein, partial [Pyrinomonadaceae bacterium]|nr:lamin tail domain-containing protein [Pyrinomonadaceae bacterium]
TLVETVARANLDGLDEVHVLLPAGLSGASASTLLIEADGTKSNPVSVVLGGAPPISKDKLVISQIYGGGGNSGAPLRNDFIEIFNAGTTSVSLSGWSVQYASATASTWSSTPLTAVILAPGQHYLIQQAGGANGAALPTPDAVGTIAMAAGAGKVALVRSTTALTGACPTDPNIIDFVGYGSTANCFRGSGPAAAASNTNAATRSGNGCTDTRNNANDFALATPNPRNTNALFIQCTITDSVLTSFADAFAQRRNHNSAPTFWLRRFP